MTSPSEDGATAGRLYRTAAILAGLSGLFIPLNCLVFFVGNAKHLLVNLGLTVLQPLFGLIAAILATVRSHRTYGMPGRGKVLALAFASAAVGILGVALIVLAIGVMMRMSRED